MKIPSNVINFAGTSNLAPYELFHDYFNHYKSINGDTKAQYYKTRKDGVTPITFEEKESDMNVAFRKEIMRAANVADMNMFSTDQWASNPNVRWAVMAVLNSLIDMILPETIIDSIGAYTDVRTIGWGDSASFTVDSRDLFAVSKSGKGQRQAEVKKQFKGMVTLIPEFRQITVGTNFYRMLTGMDSLAAFTAKAVRSLETAVAYDVYSAFAAAMAALPNTATTGLRVAGYTQAALVSMCQRVTAWNGGAKAIIMGTQLALVNVLPDDANYRYFLDSSDYVKLGYIKTAFGYDTMVLPQIADYSTPWGTLLADDRIWIVSPSSQKLVKLVLEGSTLSYTNDVYDFADMSQKTTITKSWASGVITNATAGVITF